MSDYSSRLTERIRTHLEGIIRASGLPDNAASLETMAGLWYGKKEMFEAQTRMLDMKEVDSLRQDDPRGVLLLTYSGSLVAVSPRTTEGRSLEYASIETRADVPPLVHVQRTDFAGELHVDREAAFTEGTIQNTSSLLKITVCAPDVDLEEQEKRIREGMIFLTNGFVKLNRTALTAGDRPVEQFTTKSIVTYLAHKNDLTQKQVRQLIDDYLAMIEAGMLLGERVPMGRIGRLYLRKRPAQKARVGKNPATGAEITIAAKPAQSVPKISFTRLLRDRASRTEA